MIHECEQTLCARPSEQCGHQSGTGEHRLAEANSTHTGARENKSKGHCSGIEMLRLRAAVGLTPKKLHEQLEAQHAARLRLRGLHPTRVRDHRRALA